MWRKSIYGHVTGIYSEIFLQICGAFVDLKLKRKSKCVKKQFAIWRRMTRQKENRVRWMATRHQTMEERRKNPLQKYSVTKKTVRFSGLWSANGPLESRPLAASCSLEVHFTLDESPLRPRLMLVLASVIRRRPRCCLRRRVTGWWTVVKRTLRWMARGAQKWPVYWKSCLTSRRRSSDFLKTNRTAILSSSSSLLQHCLTHSRRIDISARRQQKSFYWTRVPESEKSLHLIFLTLLFVILLFIEKIRTKITSC